MKINPKKFLPFGIVFLLFFLVTIYITYPLFFKFGSVVSGYGDELFITWVHNWVIHALFTNPFNLFQANIFHPFENTLAFSDLFLSSSILSIPVFLLTGEPISTLNFTVFSSIFLVGFSTYLLSYFLTRNHFISIFSGILIIFSPAFLDKKVHVQALSLQYIPLSILFFLIFIKIQKIRYFVLAMIFFLFQTYNSFMPGYFLVFYYVVFGSIAFILERKKLKIFINKKVAVIAVVTVLLLIPVINPYLQVSKEYNAKRDIRDAIHFALQPEDLWYAPDNTRLLPLLQLIENPSSYPSIASLKPGYIGFVFSVLILTSLFFIRRFWKRRECLPLSLVGSSLVGLILSFGPALHWGRETIHPIIPLPYAVFYYILPGFQGFRNSARFEMMFILFGAVFIAVVLNEVFKIKDKKFYFILILLIAGVVIEYSGPARFVPVVQKQNFPLEHKFLAGVDSEAVYVEMPIYNWGMTPFASQEIQRVYFSTLHFRKTVNGFSGFSPQAWEDFTWEMMEQFPNKDSLFRLKNLGVKYLIVHTDEYDRISKSDFRVGGERVKSGEEVVRELSEQKGVRLIGRINTGFIYLINND